MTPLMLACRLGHESLVEMLVDVFGAELDPEDQVRFFYDSARVSQARVLKQGNRVALRLRTRSFLLLFAVIMGAVV